MTPTEHHNEGDEAMTSVRYTIFINEASFTACEKTVDQVIEAIKSAGFTYDDETEGYVSPQYWAEDHEEANDAS